MSVMTGMSNCIHCHKLVSNGAGTCPHCGEIAFMHKREIDMTQIKTSVLCKIFGHKWIEFWVHQEDENLAPYMLHTAICKRCNKLKHEDVRETET